MERIPEAPVDPRFLHRWSPRAFDAKPIPPGDVKSLFEAARWAPSCFNEQPWRFVWATERADHARLAEVLTEKNRLWAQHAPLLGLVFASRTFAKSGKPNRWAAFDSGSASLSLTLQANELGLVTHFMGGFDQDAAYRVTGADPAAYEVIAAFAVGYPGDPASLPPELRDREQPSGRKPQREFAFEGAFPTGAMS